LIEHQDASSLHLARSNRILNDYKADILTLTIQEEEANIKDTLDKMANQQNEIIQNLESAKALLPLRADQITSSETLIRVAMDACAPSINAAAVQMS
jgi:hypothetical protein